jgi:hypothetical protein
MIIRKSCLGGLLFNEDYRWGEDLMFAIQLFRDHGLKCAFSDRRTALYYRHQGSLTDHSSVDTLAMVDTQIRLYEECRGYGALTEKAAKIINDKLLTRHLLAAYYNRRQGRMGKAIRHVLRSCRYGFKPEQIMELGKILVKSSMATEPGGAGGH